MLAHPECPPEVLAAADYVGSTSGMVRHLETAPAPRVLLVTECSMSDNVAVNFPDIEFVRPCNLCPYMKRITLPKILDSLVHLRTRCWWTRRWPGGPAGRWSACWRWAGAAAAEAPAMRYPFDRLLRADAVVVGSGIGGLTAALAMAPRRVLVVTKGDPGGGSTPWAQGGIAAAVAADDSPREHAADTVAVGGGLNDPRAVDVLTAAAPERVAALERLGVRFDTGPDGSAAAGPGGGPPPAPGAALRRRRHRGRDDAGPGPGRRRRRPRGDPALRLRRRPRRRRRPGGGGDGAHRRGGAAAGPGPGGGAGHGGHRPPVRQHHQPARGHRRRPGHGRPGGRRLADLEFVQFHPTALASGRDPMALLTEALRGEGAVLVDDTGERFMVGQHPDAELAPRDVVARAIWARLQAGSRVYLDATAAVGASFPERFPTVFDLCLEDGIDPRIQPVPVAPAAHYHMGGVATALDGRASLPGLWAVGEVACTGVHGANRLASNSLLEATVFGQRAGERCARRAPRRWRPPPPSPPPTRGRPPAT